MNKYTEQQIEEKLKQLASIEPSEDSFRQTNQRVRNIISDIDKKPTAPPRFFYYAVASAAILLIGIAFLYNSGTVEEPQKIVRQRPTEPTLTLARLNVVFNNGGQKALELYLEKAEANRQPRAETITLQEIMKEL